MTKKLCGPLAYWLVTKWPATANRFVTPDLEQYGRRENIRIHDVAESTNAKDDGEDVLFKVADALQIELAEYDIQRVHSIGVKKIPEMLSHALL